MSKPLWRTPALDPVRVAEVLAFDLTEPELEALSPRVEVDGGGWALQLRAPRTSDARLVGFCEAIDLDPGLLRRVNTSAGGGGASGGSDLGMTMLSFLLRRDWVNAEDMPARPGERMIVAPPLPDHELGELLDRINAHATVCRAARFRPAAGDHFTLFHLREDLRRGSTLELFLSSWQRATVPVLNAYATPQGTVFLPSAPPRRMLNAVAALVDRNPGMFGFAPPPRDGWEPQALLFAVTQAAELGQLGQAEPTEPDITLTARDMFFDIRSARFLGASAFSDALRPAVLTALPEADPLRGLGLLRRALAAPENGFSFPLRLWSLRQGVMAHDDHEKIANLEAEKALLERRITHAKAQAARQAVLAICPDEDLGQMIRILQKCVANSLSWEGIRYRHVASTADPNVGRHLFLFSPEVVGNVSLHAAVGQAGGIRWYWGDPGWTEVYGRRTGFQVMVPWQTHLHPVPHSWEPEDVETHLIDLVADWSDGDIRLEPGGDHVVLFDHGLGVEAGAGADRGLGQGHAQGGALQVIAMDGAGFSAITGKVVAWFNALQARQLRDLETDTLRREEAQRRDAEVAAARQAAADPDAALTEAIQTASSAMSDLACEGTAAVQAALEAEVQELLVRMDDRRAQVARLSEIAVTLEKGHEEATRIMAGIERGGAGVAGDLSRQSSAQIRELRNLLKTLEEREKQFKETTDQTRAHIIRLRKRVADLNRQWFGWFNG